MSERRIGSVPAAVGTPLTLAGVLMYALHGPGFPFWSSVTGSRVGKGRGAVDGHTRAVVRRVVVRSGS